MKKVRQILVWERATYCSVDQYTQEDMDEWFDADEQALLAKGFEVNGCVDLEAFYHRAAPLVPAE